MASYPNNIYTPREKENRNGVTYDPTKKTVIFKEDVSKLDDEVVATETELGTNPKGTHDSVKDRIADDETDLANHKADTNNPHSTTKTQVGLGNVTDDAQLKRAAGDINSFSEKATPANDDVLLLEDSADSYNKKKVKKSALGGGGGAGWELIKHATFTNDVNITGLDGDADCLWHLIIRTRSDSSYNVQILFNSDAGAHYIRTQHRAGYSGGSAIHDLQRGTDFTSMYLTSFGSFEHLISAKIASKSGQQRYVISNGNSYRDNNNHGIGQLQNLWTNTVDNITTINIITGAILAGEYWLFRQKA